MNKINKILVIFFSSAKSVYLVKIFSAFFASNLFLTLENPKPYVEKIRSYDAELARHVHKRDVKLQSLRVNGFSLFSVRVLAKPYHIGVN